MCHCFQEVVIRSDPQTWIDIGHPELVELMPMRSAQAVPSPNSWQGLCSRAQMLQDMTLAALDGVDPLAQRIQFKLGQMDSSWVKCWGNIK